MEVVGLAIKRGTRAPMEVIGRGIITLEEGLVGDHRCRMSKSTNGRRQVTIISLEQWNEACAEISTNLILPWYKRRANVCVSSVTFHEGLIGTRLALGPEVILEITGETKPCTRMDEVHPGLREKLAKYWRGGIICRVRSAGVVKKGDTVVLF